MSTDHNRIKVADLEINEPNKTLITNDNGELEFSDITGGSQDLKSVLDQGNSAQYGSNYLSLMPQTYPLETGVFWNLSNGGIGYTSFESKVNRTRIINRSNDDYKSGAISIDDGKITISEWDQSTNFSSILKFTPPISNAKYFLPAKPVNGNYTLATLDDITGGSQDLQQTLDNGKIASYDGGNSNILILEGEPNEREFSMDIGDGLGNVSNISSGTTYAAINGTVDSGNNASIMVLNGRVRIVEVGTASGVSTSFSMSSDATNAVDFKLPTKSVNGEYTLATLDDITGGEQDIQSVLNQGTFATIEGTNNTLNLGGGGDVTFYMEDSINPAVWGSFTVANNGTTINNNLVDGEIGLGATLSVVNGEISFAKSINLGSVGVSIQDPIDGENATLFFPAKPTGTYTLATLDDLSDGGSQDLQSVLEINGETLDVSMQLQNSDGERTGINPGNIGIWTATNRRVAITGNGDTLELVGENVDGLGEIKIPLTNRIAEGQAEYNFNPNHPAGVYTIATLDDITGGSQDLQQTLDNGKTASYDGGNSLISILDGTTDDRIFRVVLGDGDITNSASEIILYPSYASFAQGNSESGKGADLTIHDGEFNLAQASGSGSSTLGFQTPFTASIDLRLPTKPSAGEYIIATLDDIPSYDTPTLDEVITEGNNWHGVSFNDSSESFDSTLSISKLGTETSFVGSSVTGGASMRVNDGFFYSITASGINTSAQLSNIGLRLKTASNSETASAVIKSDLLTDSDKTIQLPNKNGTLATLDDVVAPVSSSTVGIVNNTSLQELGGVDKLINGVRIGKGPSTGIENTVTGFNSQTLATTGAKNTSIGFASLRDVTTGSFNTAGGSNALASNTTGVSNTAFGVTALSTNTNSNFNTAFGYQALKVSTSGPNDAFGASTLQSNTTGINNIAFGTSAMFNNTTGNYNSTLGSAALYNNIIGNNSCAFGRYALYNATGGNNIAIGYLAGVAITSGTGNVVIASQAAFTTSGVTTGSNNLIISQNNGQNTGVTTGSGNTIIGKVTGLPSTLSNTVVLSDGIGTQRLISSSTNLSTLPVQTTALISEDSTGKAILTKEYLGTRIGTVAPTSSADSGTAGEIRVAAGYIYWYVAGTGWLRSAGSTF